MRHVVDDREISDKVDTLLGQIGLSPTSVRHYIELYDLLLHYLARFEKEKKTFLELGKEYFIRLDINVKTVVLQVEPQLSKINSFGVHIAARRLWRRGPVVGCKTIYSLTDGSYQPKDYVALDNKVFLDRFL